MTQTVEGANVSVVSGMVELIAAHRAFEAYTKITQSIDQMNEGAINQVSRSK
jgi:flagellar basal body rod protein FlgG